MLIISFKKIESDFVIVKLKIFDIDCDQRTARKLVFKVQQLNLQNF
jgi:hypothetical protein